MGDCETATNETAGQQRYDDSREGGGVKYGHPAADWLAVGGRPQEKSGHRTRYR